jgi:hypothetical protein
VQLVFDGLELLASRPTPKFIEFSRLPKKSPSPGEEAGGAAGV